MGFRRKKKQSAIMQLLDDFSQASNAVMPQPSAHAETTELRELAHEIVAAPIEGWRVFALDAFPTVVLDQQTLRELAGLYEQGVNPFRALVGPRLCAISAGYVWKPGANEARCTHNASHQAPDPNCQCGFWVFKGDGNEVPRMKLAAQGATGSGYLWGKVRIWGRVIEHEIGYRAQHAQVIGPLYTHSAMDELPLLELAEAYGCGVAGDPLMKGAEREAANALLQQGRQPYVTFPPTKVPIPHSHTISPGWTQQSFGGLYTQVTASSNGNALGGFYPNGYTWKGISKAP